MRETELYPPIKRFLESQGYEVKAEIGPADVMALSLFHQAIERLAIADLVYVAVPETSTRQSRRVLKRNRRLCRRLGLGLITVRPRDGHVTVHCDPGPYRPRQSKQRRESLLGEFSRRSGDPNVGGSTRRTIVTAYRQDAIRCAEFLSANGATKAAHVAAGTGVPNARRIMSDNHYGWFRRVETGIYDIEPAAFEAGEQAAPSKAANGEDPGRPGVSEP
jgi:hypothetical protein